MLVSGPADNIPVGAPSNRGKHSLSSQADPRRQRTEADTSSARHPSAGESDRYRARPRFNPRPYASRHPRGAPKIQHRDRSARLRRPRPACASPRPQLSCRDRRTAASARRCRSRAARGGRRHPPHYCFSTASADPPARSDRPALGAGVIGSRGMGSWRGSEPDDSFRSATTCPRSSALATMQQFQLARLNTACPTRRFRGSPAFRWSGWGFERPATRSLDPPRSPRPGAGTTSAPTAPRNREHSRARTRRCRRAREASRPRNQYGAYRDCMSRRRAVKRSRNLSYAMAAHRPELSVPMGRKPRPPGRSHRSFAGLAASDRLGDRAQLRGGRVLALWPRASKRADAWKQKSDRSSRPLMLGTKWRADGHRIRFTETVAITR